MGETLTVKEVATTLRISRNTVHDLIARRELPCYRVGKRALRIPTASVFAYLRQHTVVTS